MSENNQWHLSKSVPISFILAIIAQTVALSFFIATLRSDVTSNQQKIMRSEVKVESLEAVVQNQAILLARIDENLKAIRIAIEEIKGE